MHPWVIWHLAEARVEELHGDRHRDSHRSARPPHRSAPPSLRLRTRRRLIATGAIPARRQSRGGVVDHLAGWAGRRLIATGTRLVRRGRPTGVGTEALGAAR
jgi:hypothetical protein